MTDFRVRVSLCRLFSILALSFVLAMAIGLTSAPASAQTYNNSPTFNSTANRWDINFAGQITYGRGEPPAANCTNAATSTNLWYIRTDASNGDEARYCNASGTWVHQQLNIFDALAGLPVCVKQTIPYTTLTAAATTQDVTLFTGPANMEMTRAYVKHTTAFAGPSISAMTVSLGFSTGLTAYTANFDILQAVANTAVQYTGSKFPTVAAHDVLAHFISTGANLSVLTAGSVDIYMCYRQMP